MPRLSSWPAFHRYHHTQVGRKLPEVCHREDWNRLQFANTTEYLTGKLHICLFCYPTILTNVQSKGDNKNLLYERRFLLPCHPNGWRMYMLWVGLHQPHSMEDISNFIRRYIFLHKLQGEKPSPPAMHVILSSVAV